jgi:hypothetical protein
LLWGNRLYRMLIKPTKFHSTSLSFGPSMVRFVARCKITTFPQTRKGMGIFLFLPMLQQPCHANAGLCGGLGSMAAACFFRSFPLDGKGTKGSRPTSRAYRTWRPPLPHVGRARAPNPVGLWRSRTWRKGTKRKFFHFGVKV